MQVVLREYKGSVHLKQMGAFVNTSWIEHSATLETPDHLKSRTDFEPAILLRKAEKQTYKTGGKWDSRPSNEFYVAINNSTLEQI